MGRRALTAAGRADLGAGGAMAGQLRFHRSSVRGRDAYEAQFCLVRPGSTTLGGSPALGPNRI
jgi:hypothetical protein